MNIFSKYAEIQNKRPYLIKSLITGFAFGLGDYLCQKLLKKPKIDANRVILQGSAGLIMTPYVHLCFNIISPKLIPIGSNYFIIKNILFTQIFIGPVTNFIYFTYLHIINKKTFEEYKFALKIKFPNAVVANWCYFPFVQAFNFKFIPLDYRVLFSNLMAVVFLTYLSYIQNEKYT